MAENDFTLFDSFLWNFYIADRNRTTFRHVEDVPDLLPKMIPMFITLLVLENVVKFIKDKKIFRINDGLTSVSMGMTMEIVKIVTHGFEMFGYSWLYQYRFFEWEWDSAWTWWGAAIGLDFCYYWLHRCVHEVNFLWAFHQSHHSSEEYNLTTALRQPIFQRLLSMGFYHPLALIGIPPAAMLVQLYFNLFYQYWIHTEFVPNLGPIEWVFNTASHHRVHHGRNKWCLDKNYGAALIIWDRIFGTFQAERTDEKVVYGLVGQVKTFEPFYLQLFYFKDVFSKVLSMDGISNKIKGLLYGPGWHPGTARLGDPAELPDKPDDRAKYNPQISTLLNVYLFVHFIVLLYLQQSFVLYYWTLNWVAVAVFIPLFFLSLFVIGSFFDGLRWVAKLEAFRCAVLGVIIQQWVTFPYPHLDTVVVVYLALSSIVWLYQSTQMIQKPLVKAKTH